MRIGDFPIQALNNIFLNVSHIALVGEKKFQVRRQLRIFVLTFTFGSAGAPILRLFCVNLSPNLEKGIFEDAF